MRIKEVEYHPSTNILAQNNWISSSLIHITSVAVAIFSGYSAFRIAKFGYFASVVIGLTAGLITKMFFEIIYEKMIKIPNIFVAITNQIKKSDNYEYQHYNVNYYGKVHQLLVKTRGKYTPTWPPIISYEKDFPKDLLREIDQFLSEKQIRFFMTSSGTNVEKIPSFTD